MAATGRGIGTITVKRPPRQWLGWAAALLVASVIAGLLAFGFPQYSNILRQLGTLVSAALSLILGVLPFPVSEWLIILAPLGFIAWVVILLRKYRFKRGIMMVLARLAFTLCLIAFIFMLVLGVQYSAPPLADSLGLYVGRYSVQQLAQLDAYLLEQANFWAGQVERNRAGECDFGPFADMAGTVMAQYDRLANYGHAGLYNFDYSVFASRRKAEPKQTLLFGVVMSYLDVAGYYFPWTGEAVVSRDSIDVTLPFTIAHEAAHSHGVGPEDEANFAAFLACTTADDARLQYSGWFRAYIYVNNALYNADYDIWAAQYQGRGELLMFDIQQQRQHLAKYDTPVAKVGSAVNNAYIVATGQPDGIRSYGKVADLLLAWYYNPET